MYLDFFKLKELPFRLAADPRFFFLGAGQEFAKSRIRTALADAEGCVLLIGDAGVGKTTLIQDVLGELPEQYVIVQLRNPEFTVDEFYQAVVAQFEQVDSSGDAIREHFEGCLTRLAVARKILVLAIDNGELVSQDLMDEFMRLGRKRFGSVRNLRLLIGGRTSVEKALRVEKPGARPVQLGLKVKLLPLTETESRQYVELRMKIAAGRPTAIFHDDAFPELQRYSGGVPRLINTLGDAALMLAFNRSRDEVTSVDVRSAVDHLKWVEFDSRLSESDIRSASGLQQQVNAEAETRGGHLRIELGESVVAAFDLPIGKITLGRALNNDVRIESQFISRHHCQILTTSQYSVIEDLQSQNGVTVGSRRVSVHRLQDGDRIILGDHALVYSRSEVPASSSASHFPVVLNQRFSAADTNKTRVLRSTPTMVDSTDAVEK